MNKRGFNIVVLFGVSAYLIDPSLVTGFLLLHVTNTDGQYMPRFCRNLSTGRFRCLKFSEGWLVSENICTQKLQIRNFVHMKNFDLRLFV